MDTAATIAALRAADFVELPQTGSAGLRRFVVDDLRPMVTISDLGPGQFCAVTAESRTGQTARVAALVAETFPGAASVPPGDLGATVEDAWLVASDPPTFVMTMRTGAPSTPALYSLATMRSAPTAAPLN